MRTSFQEFDDGSELGIEPAWPCDFSASAEVLPVGLEETCRALARMTDIPVLLQGETGTGKGLLAKYIMRLRKKLQGDLPFVALSCASLNNDVADATLFGHRRGAFTGAHDTATGAVGEAGGGILFLDEIHCLSISTQRKLLRVLDDGAYSRVGESLERKADFQLIAATNSNLGGLVQSGDFLLDLLMRIQGISIALPPLRERKNDIPALIARYIHSHQLPVTQKDFAQLVDLCLPLHWPGNVRQLYKALDAMRFKAKILGSTVFAPQFEIDLSMQAPQPHGTASLWHQPSLPPVPSAAASAADAASERADEGEGEGEGEREGKSLGESHSGGPSVDEVVREILRVRQSSVDLGSLLEAVESSLIRYSLTRNRSITDVMSHLKLSRGKLDFKRRKYKLMDFAPQPSSAD